MAETVVVKPKAQYAVGDVSWFRICRECGFKQSEDWDLNDVCQNCGEAVILSMPQNSGYEDIEL